MQINIIIFFLTGILFAALALPLIKRKVKINSWYGIRIPQTMENEKVWFKVNSIMGKYLFVLGIFISGLSLYFVLNPTDPGYLMVYILLGVTIVGTIMLVVLSFKVANKISIQEYRKGNGQK